MGRDERAGSDVRVRNTRPDDFADIVRISREIYPDDRWYRDELAHHHRVFPEGQLVAVSADSDQVLGMAASLIVVWDEYEPDESWETFTDDGWFTNHDPSGRTLYGAEIMVAPAGRRRGVGTALYQARRELVRRLGLARIRCHARLAGYHRHADRLDPRAYVRAVIARELLDPTLSFQLRQGFEVLAVVSDYLPEDPESLGWAALIEWNAHEPVAPS